MTLEEHWACFGALAPWRSFVTLNEVKGLRPLLGRFFAALRMTEGERLRMTCGEGLAMT